MSVMRIAHIRAAPGANAMYIAAFDCCRPPEPLSLRVAYALKSRDTFAQGRVHETRETGSANDDSNQLKFPSAVNPATRAVLLQGEELFPYKTENSLWLFLTRSSFARVFPESQPRFDSIRLLVPCPSRIPHLSFPSYRIREIGLRFAVDARGVPIPASSAPSLDRVKLRFALITVR